jgi:hypothetical protein
MVEFLAGNRIRGTNAEKIALGFGQSLTDSGTSKSNCIAYYNFEQTSGNLINQATTASGFTNGLGTALVGTNSGATQTATGKIGNAWDFDGSNDYVSTPTNSAIPIGTEPCSFNIWVNPDTFTGYNTMFSLGTGASNQALYVTNDGNANDGGIEVHRYGGTVVTSGSTNMILNAWNMVTLTYTGSSVLLFLDGVQVGSGTHSFGTNDTGIRIGKNSHGGEFFGGRLDEFSVWTRVLTPAEITTLYQEYYKLSDGSIFYETDNNKSYVLYNSTWSEL